MVSLNAYEKSSLAELVMCGFAPFAAFVTQKQYSQYKDKLSPLNMNVFLHSPDRSLEYRGVSHSSRIGFVEVLSLGY